MPLSTGTHKTCCFVTLEKPKHEKLQRVQNIAARLITGRSRRGHITPLLKNLHWLPDRSRITFKILLLTYKILNGHSPSYLTSLISSYKPCQLVLYVHPTNYKTDLASRLRQTANGKRQAEISRLPKTREIYFGFSLYFAC